MSLHPKTLPDPSASAASVLTEGPVFGQVLINRYNPKVACLVLTRLGGMIWAISLNSPGSPFRLVPQMWRRNAA